MPFGLSISFEKNVENYNLKKYKIRIKKMIIAIAGPLTNFIFILIFLLLKISFLDSVRELIIYANILIGIFNLVPIYPLDGGRIIKCMLEIFLDNKNVNKYINSISYIVIILLTAISSIAVLYIKNIAIVIILTYLWFLVIRENKKYLSFNVYD